jgi:hypothetical protein
MAVIGLVAVYDPLIDPYGPSAGRIALAGTDPLIFNRGRTKLPVPEKEIIPPGYD